MVIQQLEPLFINHNNTDHSANDKKQSNAGGGFTNRAKIGFAKAKINQKSCLRLFISSL